MTDYPSSTTGGRYCETCHTWIPWGTFHFHPEPIQVQPPQLPPVPQIQFCDSRIVPLLERIIVALEKIVFIQESQRG